MNTVTFRRISVALATLFCAAQAQANNELKIPLKGLAIATNPSPAPTPEPAKIYAKWDIVVDGSAAENIGSFSVSDDKYSVFTIVPNGGRKVPASQSTTCKSAGKWYWEVSQGAHPYSYTAVSIHTSNTGAFALGGLVQYYWGKLYTGTSESQTGLVSTVGQEGTYGVALDADARTVQFYWNGIAQGAPTTLPAAPAYCPGMSGQLYAAPAGTLTMTINSGYAPFKYAPPAGYASGIY